MELKIKEAEKLSLSDLESAVRALKISIRNGIRFGQKRIVRNDNKDHGCLSASFEVAHTGKSYIVNKIK